MMLGLKKFHSQCSEHRWLHIDRQVAIFFFNSKELAILLLDYSTACPLDFLMCVVYYHNYQADGLKCVLYSTSKC